MRSSAPPSNSGNISRLATSAAISPSVGGSHGRDATSRRRGWIVPTSGAWKRAAIDAAADALREGGTVGSIADAGHGPAFGWRLPRQRDAVDLETGLSELLEVVNRAVESAQASVCRHASQRHPRGRGRFRGRPNE
jgi:hypothetical protein